MKKFVLVVALIVVALMVTACGGKSGNAYPSSAPVTPSGDFNVVDDDNPDGDDAEIVHKCGGTVVLADYSELTKPEPYVGVTDEEVEEMFKSDIDEILQMYPNYEKDDTHTETVISDGDIVNIDFVGKLDNVAFEGGSGTDYYLAVGSGQFIEDFEKGMIGKKIGETFDITAVVPENYQSEDLAGKTTVFTITANFFGKEKDEADDAYMARLSGGMYNSLAEYKAVIKEYMEESARAEYEGEAYGALLNELISKSTFEMLDEDIEFFENDTIQYYTNQAGQSGLSLEDYAVTALGEASLDAFLNQIHDDAIQMVKESMITDAVAEKENIVVTEELYQQEIGKYTDEASGFTIEKLETYFSKEYLWNIAYQDLVDATIYKKVMGE